MCVLHITDLDKRAKGFIEYARNANKAYRTNHVAITTGMDFHYQVIWNFLAEDGIISSQNL